MQLISAKPWRLASLAAVALATGALAGCGPQFDKSFNTAWAKKTHDSCVPSAVNAGATPAVAETYCTCVVTQLSTLTVQQKMSLNPSTSPEAQAAVKTCAAQAHAGQ